VLIEKTKQKKNGERRINTANIYEYFKNKNRCSNGRGSVTRPDPWSDPTRVMYSN